MSAAEDRQREIFPLPHLGEQGASNGPCARSVSRRRQRRDHWRAWANRGIDALNAVYGAADDDPGPSFAQQRRVLDFVAEQYVSVGKPPADAPSAGALSALCGGSVLYNDIGTTVLPYTKDLVDTVAEPHAP